MAVIQGKLLLHLGNDIMHARKSFMLKVVITRPDCRVLTLEHVISLTLESMTSADHRLETVHVRHCNSSYIEIHCLTKDEDRFNFRFSAFGGSGGNDGGNGNGDGDGGGGSSQLAASFASP